MSKEKVKVMPELQSLIPTYMKNIDGYISDMQAKLKEEDFDSIRITGHGLKGSGGGYGFPRITEIGKEIEEAAKVKDAATISQSITDLETYIANIEIVYE